MIIDPCTKPLTTFKGGMSSTLMKPHWEKDLVVGYHKEAQALYPNQIPSEVANLCLDYYHELDYFYKCHVPENMEISDKQMTVRVLQGTGSYVGGKINTGDNASSMMYLWTFQITGRAGRAGNCFTSFGITNANYHNNTDKDNLFDAITNDSYRYYCDGKTVHCDEMGRRWGSSNKVKKEGFNNDIIQMRVDTCAGSISYQVNGKDRGIVFEGIDFKTKKYRMFLYAGNKGECIKLIDFRRIIVRES